ncbi:MAG TPA: hypothetical protein P5567_06940 [Kiritimatiellia bacterium]|nr:hypothetical protein [Kiritimatiellia bacterium]HRZ12174.1 hypothetical protein [Kiritimatiellia bacterium]HSA18068.1 hypothetical protein [Kiritimatiellia bacterium]
MKHHTVAGLFLAAAWLAGAAQADDLDARVRAFTGARTRAVWCRQAEGAGEDVFARGRQLQVWGYDSGDGLGERVILGAVTNYHRPMITPKGDRIVFNNLRDRLISVVRWDGSGLRTLTNGTAADVWLDPATGVEWVYMMVREIEEFHSGPVIRFQLDNPAVSEVVLDRQDVTWDNFQLSADGTRASGQFPHPRAGYVRLPGGDETVLGKGCWTSMAPDNSYLSWIFDGPHRNLHLFAPDGRHWKVTINGAPGVAGYEVYHPRWSNHARYFAMTGPYKVGPQGKNLIAAGGGAVDVYLGRFSPDFTAVEDWLKLTGADQADFFPDLWIEGGRGAAVTLPAGQPAQAPEAATKPGTRVKVEARLAASIPTPSVASISPYTQALVVYTYEVVKVLEGECSAPRILVAHWAIRDKQVLDLDKEQGGTYPLELELFDAHPELEGERLFMETEEFDLPLFYSTGN